MAGLSLLAPRLVLGLSDRLLGLPTVLQLRRLAREGRSILVGPWLSEVGYELLYWIPFLRWAVKSAGIDPSRLVVVSRGGVTSWYGELAARYVDLFDLFELDEFRRLNERRLEAQRGEIKHWRVSEVDREVARRVAEKLGVDSLALLHPAQMYRCLQYYWLGRAGRHHLDRHTSYAALPGPASRLEDWLPNSFVAAKFYFNASFPETAANRAFVQTVLGSLTSEAEVVLLNTGLVVDDHLESWQPTSGRIWTLDRVVTPRNNLELQTRVVAGARAFVGTYGGFAYLAPLLGVDALTFYSRPDELNLAHLELARQTLPRLANATFQALEVRDLERFRGVLAQQAALTGAGSLAREGRT